MIETALIKTEVERITRFVCDLCKVEAFDPTLQGKWENEVGKTEITIQKTVDRGDTVNTQEYDICPDCWEDHIEQLFKRNGVEARVKEW